uniref:Peptidase M3A/M3B catalytic domain-containing protein n=1 Tax=Quercus lobata TaxID=97700 RepID=A0A7N2RD03_QUELO
MKAMGPKFRDTILALGGGKAPKEVFRDFRGRNPLPKALLRSIRVRCPPESSSVSSAFLPESSSESSPESSHQLKRRSESLHQQRRRI